MTSLDPTVRHLLAHPRHSIVHDGMLGSGHDENTRTYLDWHERNVETRFRLVGQSGLGSSLQAGIALHRTRTAGRYDPHDIAQFALVHEHLHGDGLRLSADGIHAAARREDEQLQALLMRTIGLRQSGRSSGEVLRVSRPSGRQPCGVRITAVARPPVALTSFRPAVCRLISDPEQSTRPSVPQLQTLFNLTRAEARLAVRLSAGQSLRTAAARLGITYGTARSRLTHVFRKTNAGFRAWGPADFACWGPP